MKLQRKKRAPAKSASWHPSFRFDDRLPDLKVVRTSFFVNMLFVTLAMGALLFTVYREYYAYSLRSDAEAALAGVERSREQNSKLLGMSNEFAAAAKRFSEIERFQQAPFRTSELLIALSRTLPQFIDFTSVSYDRGSLYVRGTIRGASDTASARLSVYLDTLRATPEIERPFPEISLTSLLRDPRSQGLSFEIQLKGASNDKPANPQA